MVQWRDPQMGRFAVEVELANNDDLALIVDCTRQSLEPRDPRQIISELD